ncbi:LTA synthase family protein, partial [Helicobacter canis]
KKKGKRTRRGGGGGGNLKDSASGNHCTDFTNFERTADLKSSSLSKFVKNSTSNTAIPRILEQKQQLESKSVDKKQTQPLESHSDSENQAPTLFTQAFFARAGVFLFSFCTFFPFFSTLWVRRFFGKVDITQIIFHLRFPVAPNGVDIDFIFSFVALALLPSLAISLALTYPSGTARLFVASYEICARLFLWSKELVRSHSLIARYVFIALLSVYGWNYVGKKLKISEFIASNKVHKTYANFYESYYKAPDIESIKQSFSTIQKPRNLLVIYMESMEATFGSNDARDFAVKISLPFAELTQNLNSLASSGISFSHIRQTTGTGWTIAGLISYNCAFPQTWLPFNAGFNDSVAHYFLHSATCLGDVFSALGYEQAFFRGANADFAGSRGFFASHSIPMNDLSSIEAYAQGFEDYRNDWGVKDSVLFAYVKEYLQEYAAKKDKKPFAFYVLTADTHAPGFVDKAYCDLPTSYANSLHCSDKIVGDFVQWFLQSPLAKDTTLVLLGDHLTMQQRFVQDGTSRSIYNAFINPAFTKPPTQNLTKSRLLSHFDITALLLDSIAIPTRDFGLGRNPLYERTLLEQLGESSLATELSKPSRVYERFWEFDSTKELH